MLMSTTLWIASTRVDGPAASAGRLARLPAPDWPRWWRKCQPAQLAKTAAINKATRPVREPPENRRVACVSRVVAWVSGNDVPSRAPSWCFRLELRAKAHLSRVRGIALVD